MKVLITGGSSLLGKYLLATLPKGWQATAMWYTNYAPGCVYQMDVCNQSQVRYIFGRVKPDVVIHCAALGDVDYAERNYTEVETVNLGGTRNVLAAAKEYRALFVLTSTNAVFGGDQPPYAEDSPRQPVNAYGRIRVRVEDEVLSARNWLIVRLFLLYGWPPPGARGNWAETLVSGLKSGKKFKMVNDTYWQPTYAGDAARSIWKLVQGGARDEVYHVAGSNRVTLYEFARAVALTWSLDKSLLEPVDSDAFPTIARRPMDSTYDLSKLHALGIKPSGVLEGLAKMKREKARKE
jgi:dTDP-4-dehydrorhamnose reductase